MKNLPLTRNYRAEPQQVMFSTSFLSLNRAAQRFDFTVRQPEPGVNPASVGGPTPHPRAAAATRRANAL
jgi:hypothetical protein